MGSKAFRQGFPLLLLLLFINAVPIVRPTIFTSLLTHSSYASIDFAFEQIRSSEQFHLELQLKESNRSILCDVGTSVKALFDMINRTSTLHVLITDACQNVLSSIAETATYLQLPVVSDVIIISVLLD
jgi:hypothetical protein